MNTPTPAGKESPDAAALLDRMAASLKRRDEMYCDLTREQIELLAEYERLRASADTTATVHAQAVTQDMVCVAYDAYNARRAVVLGNQKEWIRAALEAALSHIDYRAALAAPPVELPGKTQADVCGRCGGSGEIRWREGRMNIVDNCPSCSAASLPGATAAADARVSE